jgi:hypothetical protein
VTVRTLAGSVWADTMVMTPDVTVGVFAGADEYMFGEIRSFVVSRAGDIYIMDRQVPA